MRPRDVDTAREVETPAAVRELMDRVFSAPEASKTALAKELERMLQQVLETEADEDRLCILFVRKRPVPPEDDTEMHALPDGSLVVPTPWLVSSRDRVAARIAGEHADLLVDHDDPRGIACFPSALLD